MNNKKTILRIKIFISIFIALFVVSYGAPNLFIAGTTQFNQEFIARILLVPKYVYAYIQHPTDSEARTDQIETVQMPAVKGKESLEYKPLQKGIYAAEDPDTKEKFVKIEKGTLLEKHKL